MAFGNLSATSWSAEHASCVILTLFKPKLFLKLWNHPFLTSDFPVLDPSPSFCFTLSCNYFLSNCIRIYRYVFLIAILHTIKAAFLIQDKSISQKFKVFMPIGIATASYIFSNFFFFLINSPYTGFIHLKMMDNHSYRPQSVECTKKFNFSFQGHDYSLLLRRTSSITSGIL